MLRHETDSIINAAKLGRFFGRDPAYIYILQTRYGMPKEGPGKFDLPKCLNWYLDFLRGAWAKHVARCAASESGQRRARMAAREAAGEKGQHARPLVRVERKCLHCDSAFICKPASPKKFCSKACVKKYAGARRTTFCAKCGVLVHNAPSCKKKFCPECYKAVLEERKARILARVCSRCGKAGLDAGRKFCSFECANEARKKTINLLCTFCGDHLVRDLADQKRHTNLFCTKDCADAFVFYEGTVPNAKEAKREYVNLRASRRAIRTVRSVLRESA